MSAPEPFACRRFLLCAGLFALLLGSMGAAWAAPAAAVNAAAVDAPAVDAAAAAGASGADATFERGLLSGAGENTTNLARFEHGNPVLPGSYSADIYLNNAWIGRSEVRFANAPGATTATPCISRQLLDQLGLHPDTSNAKTPAALLDPAACISLDSLIPGATMVYDMTDLRLDVSVPQSFMRQQPRGYVSPEYWDAGVPAGLLNYNFNAYHSTSQGQSLTSAYLGLNAGFNLGRWHFREDSSLNWQSATTGASARTQWQKINTYVQRDLPALQAQLTLGDSYTDGQVFNSYGLRGVQLATDDRMLPQSLQGFAPIVHGVANTNALVTVRQNGIQIYQTTVSPGPFDIKDLYPTGYGGSLDVTVTEADGRVRSFSVPYASVVQLLRPGVTRFDVAVGQLRNPSIEHEPGVAQATLQHGFSNLLTGYAGIVASPGYAAALLGGAVNTRLGAVALDVTEARAQIPGYATQSGQSARLSYSKIFTDTGTSLSVAAYRYSTSGYFSLLDAAQARDDARRGIDPFNYVAPVVSTSAVGDAAAANLLNAPLASISAGSTFISSTGLQRPRSTFSVSTSQTLGAGAGSLYANTSVTDYWNKSGNDTQFQVGYNNAFHHVSYSISAARTHDQLGNNDTQFLLNFSIPLGDHSHSPNLGLSLTNDKNAGSQEQAMISGTAGSDNQYNYGATASHNGGGSGMAESINGGYRSPFAVFNASYGSGSGYAQDSLNVSGAVVAHPGGITFGQPISGTIGIVYAPGADGARITNAAGARIDHAGYALVPYLTPYVLNTIQIDPKGLPLDVQLDATSSQVAPHQGAVVMLKFKTQSGRALIIRARLSSGKVLPFGAEVFNSSGASLGVVGQAGQALLRGVDDAGLLFARWQDDDGAAFSCSFAYRLKKPPKGARTVGYQQIDTVCSAAPDHAAGPDAK